MTEWKLAPSDSASTRCAASDATLAPASPSLRATWTASNSPPVARAAMRAPRRSSVSPSGPPVSATTTRSRVSHVPVDAVLLAVALQSLVDRVGEPEQGELAQRRQVAGAEVVATSAASIFSGA